MFLQRIKDSVAVLLGRAKAVAYIPKVKNINFINEKFSKEDMAFLESISIEFIFSEFGEERTNGGGTEFSKTLEDRLNPSLCTLKKYFPNAKYTVYSDFDLNIEGVELIKVKSPVIESSHPRYGYRTADYYKFYSLVHSKADFKCILDSDMQVVSSDIIALIYLTQKFGFCVPYNDRQLLRQDMRISKDTQAIDDNSKGLGHSYNQSPMTLWKGHTQGDVFYNRCAEIMKKDPSRASLVMWKSAWELGVYPYILPKQWCVCDGNEGIGDEVLLHIGHPSIDKYYNK
ncbi:hypothetical protein [Riemerella anatipestifer]|uniref:Uncharacterized protein n=1 Tax=Riemerella anatipestifer RA-CH-1 TaxID=1228997 RepID=J9QST4_RIEAN|nr:hypothetical protein [Riemerella anatipestifer]AFR35036.1 hypothetical protein B739_0432 [Riemerella anatipestifer RA-CH-1]MCO7332106.1 hypothetical protein [Riemerella anatipestifer]MCO7351061.1 hypothetical protein [Riemerella anatipestifer]MCU7581936.1 hypothetical protein [Riemerella anatipestifer]MCW0486861.1 hypothetical protein [Riemerella anatipestifer]